MAKKETNYKNRRAMAQYALENEPGGVQETSMRRYSQIIPEAYKAGKSLEEWIRDIKAAAEKEVKVS